MAGVGSAESNTKNPASPKPRAREPTRTGRAVRLDLTCTADGLSRFSTGTQIPPITHGRRVPICARKTETDEDDAEAHDEHFHFHQPSDPHGRGGHLLSATAATASPPGQKRPGTELKLKWAVGLLVIFI